MSTHIDFEGLDPSSGARTLARHAFVWGFPLVATARIRQVGTRPDDPFCARAATSTGAPLNRWGSQSRPADPTFRAGVGPSVDLLYSSLRLDFDTGPFVVEAPNCGDRYYTVQIAFADSSAERSYGSRTHGPQLPALFLTGPGDETPAPAGMLHIVSPTRYCLLPTRFLFDPSDPEDLDLVRELQAQLRVRTYADHVAGRSDEPPVPPQRSLLPHGHSADDPLTFLHELGSVLQDWIVRPSEKRIVDCLRTIGLTPERGFAPRQSDEETQAALVAGLAEGREVVRLKSISLGSTHDGWAINYLGPRFGDDILLRAGVAKDQIIVTVPEEALYPLARRDADGDNLVGSATYTLEFDGDSLPPAEAFWSVTLYGDDGFLVNNPIDRYAVSDRTPDIVRSADGGIAITISHDRPSDGERNWLPAPIGEFYLMLRLYIPGASALDGSWKPPAVRRLGN